MNARILTLCAIAVGTLTAAPAPGQKPLAFDAASVKLSPSTEFGRGPGNNNMGAKYDASRLTITSMPLRDVIVAAYRLKTYQLDVPDWSRSLMVNISATLPAGETEDHIPEMLQTLLAERFGLKVHESTTDQPAYILTAKKGIKLKDAPPDDPDAPHVDPKGPDFGMFGRLANSKMSGDPMRGMVLTTPQGQTMKMSMSGGGIHIESSKMSMPDLADELSMFLDLPVLDKTGFAGNYSLGLDLSTEDMMNMMRRQGFGGGPPPGDFPGGGPFQQGGGDGGSIMLSIQQLGLKLDKQKVPGLQLIVDHLDKASSEN